MPADDINCTTPGLNDSKAGSLQWHHNERDGVSHHRRIDCLLNRLFRRRSNWNMVRVTGPLIEGNPPLTSGFPSRRASNADNVSIWWRHHVRLLSPKIRRKPGLIDGRITLKVSAEGGGGVGGGGGEGGYQIDTLSRSLFIHCNSFEDRVPVYLIYEYLILK